MSTTVRIILAVLTLLTTLALVSFAVVGLVIGQPLLTVVCLLLSAVFGYFDYRDYQFFFGQTTTTTTTPPPPPPPVAPPPAP